MSTYVAIGSIVIKDRDFWLRPEFFYLLIYRKKNFRLKVGGRGGSSENDQSQLQEKQQN